MQKRHLVQRYCNASIHPITILARESCVIVSSSRLNVFFYENTYSLIRINIMQQTPTSKRDVLSYDGDFCAVGDCMERARRCKITKMVWKEDKDDDRYLQWCDLLVCCQHFTQILPRGHAFSSQWNFIQYLHNSNNTMSFYHDVL